MEASVRQHWGFFMPAKCLSVCHVVKSTISQKETIMATVIYPASLPKPLINITRAQSPGFQLKQPIAGPGYVKQMTSDSPATYELSWRMNREKALQFMAWFYGKAGLNLGFNRFTISVDTEFGPQDHTFQLTPDNLLPSSQEASNVFSYSATAICRKVPIPAVYTDHADLIVLDAYNYRAEIDVSMNQVWPESYPEPVVIPGTTAAFTSGLYYSSNNAVAFSDLVTFSRATTATYIDKDGVLKTAAISDPRFEKDGLLIEGQSTNLITNSETVNFSVYNGVTEVTTDTTTVPGFRLVKLVNDGSATGNNPNVATGLSFSVGDTLTFSAIFKMEDGVNGGRFRLRLADSSYWRDFSFYCDMRDENISGVTYTKTTPFANKSLVKVTASWVCDVEKTGVVMQLQSLQAAGVCYVGCFQFEKLQFASSYIPTNGASATRAADSASVLMQPHSAGTIFSEFISESVAIESIIYTAGAITMKRLATGAISVTSGSVTVTSAVVPSGSVKSAISYDGSTLKLAVNGVVYSAASTLPSAGTSLVLGASTFANIWQRSEAYDDDRLIEVTQ